MSPTRDLRYRYNANGNMLSANYKQTNNKSPKISDDEDVSLEIRPIIDETIHEQKTLPRHFFRVVNWLKYLVVFTVAVFILGEFSKMYETYVDLYHGQICPQSVDRQNEEDLYSFTTYRNTRMAYSRRVPMHLYRRIDKHLALPFTNIRISLFSVATVVYTAALYFSGGAGNFLRQSSIGQSKLDPMLVAKAGALAGQRFLAVTTWNVAAINNNPFEYWITYNEDPEYENIMKRIEFFIETPGEMDVRVDQVFTNQMFNALDKRMNDVGWQSVRSYWDDNFKDRKIISGFIKDKGLGTKRLASMPDRVTNTINVANSDLPVCRPTVINMYDGDLGSIEQWWKAWQTFMFDTPVKLTGSIRKTPYEMLQPIRKAKYPSITEDEEKVSLPLQTMSLAIFDAILVHMMNSVSSSHVWQPLKKTMVDSLIKNKVRNTLNLLSNVYDNSDVITLQEVSSALINQAKLGKLGEKYWIVCPQDMDVSRDQNSVILLNKNTFPDGPLAEITSKIYDSFPQGTPIPVAKGDILAITALDQEEVSYVIASFHGDTNGLATIPVNAALIRAIQSDVTLRNHKLIFGLDANTYEHAIPGQQQDVLEWGSNYLLLGLTSCWGDVPQKTNYTTFNARTYLQPQLNKACKSTEKRLKGDVNPKDFIVFTNKDFKVHRTWKDNTGARMYIEDMAFPTLHFPSDHGILATILEIK